nr:cytochrome bc complex cytochrome b subunit [Moraxella bovoculi]
MMSIAKKFMGWVDARYPATETYEYHMSKYYAPKNFNFWYFFGVLSMVVLVNQLVTGIWLTMMFNPSAEGAFASLEYIMRDVKGGWLIRYMHSTGASAFFIVVYLHMFRGLLYGSYQKPRELVWLIGMAIYLCLMAEGFFGYLLPWGNMSFWGAQVILNLPAAIPVIGDGLAEWVKGDYLISGITLNRFFALHVVAIPLILVGLVFMHLVALHHVGSNNPDGIDIKKLKDKNGVPLDGVPFHPYYTVHDMVGIVVFFICFFAVVFFAPEGGGYFLEKPNFEVANALKTPEHIAPVWYYMPFYAILRAVPSKLGGVIAMGAAIAVLFVLPWLDRSPVRSIRYKGILSKIALAIFVVSFLILGYLGGTASTPTSTIVGRICTILYFLYFLLMPFYTSIEKCKQPPERVTGGH